MRFEDVSRIRRKIVNILPPSWRKTSQDEVEQVKAKILETLKNVGLNAEIDVLMVDEAAKSLILLQRLRKIVVDELGKPVKTQKHGKLSSYIRSYEKLCSVVLNWIEGLALTRKARLTLKQQEAVKNSLEGFINNLMGIQNET